MSRIFLSHSSSDDLAAVALRDWLAAEGWDDVFLDFDPNRGIVAGQRWERRLHEAASRCEAVVFLVSAHWLASGWCMKEYTTARRLNKKLFAVLIDPTKTLADLPPELTDTWQVTDLAGGTDMVVFHAVRPGTQAAGEIAFNRDGLTRLKRGLQKAGLDARFFAWPPEGELARAPYRGLKPLEAADAGIFFGRDAPIVEATDRMRGLGTGAPPRLMVILGASGAGKSSFLRAGLLPRLARDDTHFVVLPPIRPERAAMTGENGFLRALATVCPDRMPDKLAAAVAAGAAALRPILADLVDAAFRRTLAEAGSTSPPTVVIAIDQAEELFRAEGLAEAQALLDLVTELTTTDDPVAVIVIFSIRSDSYDALEHARVLEGLRQDTIPLLPMPRGAYKEVIEGPALRATEAGGKLAIEPQLTERLLEDIQRGAGSDALPLLAFALEQLYLAHQQTGLLKLADYEAAGGLGGAIDAAVARAFGRADADPRIPRERAAREKLLRRGLIPWLAGVDPDTKSPRRNIARRADIPVEAAPLIDLLVEERLLSTDIQRARDPETGAETQISTIEPTHEALLRQWGLLDGWLAEDFGLLATLEGVQRAVRDWTANGRDPAWLAHGGGRLAEAQGLDVRPDIAVKLDATDRAYIAACREREEAARAALEQRRLEREAEQERRVTDAHTLAAATRRTARRTRIGLAVALVLAAAAVGFGLFARSQKTLADQKTVEAETQTVKATEAAGEATRQKIHAEAQEKQAFAEKRRADVNADEATKSARIAQERLRTSQLNESASLAEQSLREGAAGDTTNAIRLALAALPEDLDRPDRAVLARAYFALEKAVWDHRLRLKIQAGSGQVGNAIFSPDGKTILVAGRDGWLSLVDARAGTRIWQVDDKRHEVLRSIFSEKGRRVATLYDKPASIVVRNAADAAIVTDIILPSGFARGGTIAFSPDGQRVYYHGGPLDRSVHIWDVATKRAIATWPDVTDTRFVVKQFQITRNGALVISSPRETAVFEAETGAKLVSDLSFDEPIYDIVAPGDGPELFLRGRSKVFVLSDGRQVSRSWAYTESNPRDVFLVSPDKKTVFLPTSETEFAALDAVDGTRRQTFRGSTAPLTSVALSPDGHRVAALTADNSIRVWGSETGAQQLLLKEGSAQFRNLSFSADSRSLMSQADSSVYLWDISSAADVALPSGLDREWKVLKTDMAGATAVVNMTTERFASKLAIVDLSKGRIVAPLDDALLQARDSEIVFSPSSKLVAVPRFLNSQKAGNAGAGIPGDATGSTAFEDWQKGSAVVEIRNTSTGDLVTRFASSRDGYERVNISPDDKFICLQTGKSSSKGAYVFEVFELSGGRRVLSSERDSIEANCMFSERTVVLSSNKDEWTDVNAWDLAEGRELFPRRRFPTGRHPSAQIVGSGQRLLVAGDEHPPVLLDVRTGAPAAALATTLVGVDSMSPVGSGLVVLRRMDKSWALWKVANQPPRALLHGGSELELVDVSKDGTTALLRAHAGEANIYRVVNVQTGNLLFASAPTSYESYKAISGKFSKNGKALAIQIGEREVEVVSLGGLPASTTISAREKPYAIKLTDDGRWLLTFSKTGVMEVWDTNTGRQTYSRSDLAVESPNVVSGSWASVVLRDGTAELVDLAKSVSCWKSHAGGVKDAITSPDGRRLFALFPDRAVVYDLTSSRELTSFRYEASKIYGANLLPDGVHVRIVALAGSGARSALIDLESGLRITEADAEDTISWIPTRADVYFVHESSGIAVRSFSDGRLVRTIKIPQSEEGFVLSPSGDALASLMNDKTIVIGDLASGEVSTLTWLKGSPKSIRFGATKHELLVHDVSGLLSLWDLTTRRRLSNFVQPWSQEPVGGWLARSDPSGAVLAVATPDRWIRVYTVSTGAEIMTIPLVNASATVQDIAILDQTMMAVLTTYSGKASLGFVELPTKKMLRQSQLVGDFNRLSRHALTASENTRLVAVAPDGTASVSTSRGTIETLKSGAAFARAEAVLSHDGRFLVVTGESDAFRLWDTSAQEIIAEWALTDKDGRPSSKRDSTMTPTVSADDQMIVLPEYMQQHVVRLPLRNAALMAKARALLGTATQTDRHVEKDGPRLGVAMRGLGKNNPQTGGEEGGVLLMEVVPDSPAAFAGLRAGDIITEIRNRHVNDPQDVSKAVQETPPGAELPIGVLRDGHRLALSPHL